MVVNTEKNWISLKDTFPSNIPGSGQTWKTSFQLGPTVAHADFPYFHPCDDIMAITSAI